MTNFVGIHYSSGKHDGAQAYYKACADAGSPLALVTSLLEGGVAIDVEKNSPKTWTIYRWTPPADGNDDPPISGDPIAVARERYAQAEINFRLNPGFDFYACTNELNPAKNDAGANTWAAAYYLELMKQSDAHGRKFVWGNFSAGCPDYPDWVFYGDAIKFATNNGHPLGLHEYGLQYGAMRNAVAGELVLRYRKVYDIFRENDWGWPLLAITECGPGSAVDDPAVALEDAKWYNDRLSEDFERGITILGASFYNWGGAEAVPFARFMPLLVKWLTTPTPQPTVVTYNFKGATTSVEAMEKVRALLDPMHVSGELSLYGEWQS